MPEKFFGELVNDPQSKFDGLIQMDKIADRLVEKENGEWDLEHRQDYLAQGLEFTVNIHKKKPDTIVFLDRSARPLAGFIRQIWARVYEGEDAPEMKFLNLHVHGTTSSEKIADAFKASKDDFIGKVVLVVDECVTTGATLKLAKDRLQHAFPGINNVHLGGIEDWRLGQYPVQLDVEPPKLYKMQENGSENNSKGFSLGNFLWQNPNKEVVNVREEALVMHDDSIPASQTYTAKLREVGKNETLNPDFLNNLYGILGSKEALKRAVTQLKGRLGRKEERSANMARIAALEKQIELIDAAEKLTSKSEKN